MQPMKAKVSVSRSCPVGSGWNRLPELQWNRPQMAESRTMVTPIAS